MLFGFLEIVPFVWLVAFLLLDWRPRVRTVVLREYRIGDGEDLSPLKGKPRRILRKSIIITCSLYKSAPSFVLHTLHKLIQFRKPVIFPYSLINRASSPFQRLKSRINTSRVGLRCDSTCRLSRLCGFSLCGESVHGT